MRGLVVTIALVLTTAAAAATGSGLAGHVRRATGDVAAPARAMQLTLVFTRPGRSYRVRSGPDGAYRILLPPGIYRVGTIPRIGITAIRIRPSLVKVRAGHLDTLDFLVVTGIP